MHKLLLSFFSLVALVGSFACGSQENGADTPTEAYKRLYAAVKSKDTESIKKQLTKKTVEFGAMSAQRYNNPLEKAYENAFTGTTFSDSLPPIRDERIKDDMGAIEVWNSKESKWEDLPFIKEDGSWKLAVGELFAGSFKSPGRGRDSREKEAANAIANTAVQSSPNINTRPPADTNSR